MNSRSGDRVPAGVSGQAGRGTVGTDAPTAPNGSATLAVAVFSPVMWCAAAGYAVLAAVLLWLSLLLAPWGLLILAIAFGAFLAAGICALVAAGIAELEADQA